MVAQFLRLKLRLLANTFRRSPWQVIGILIALLYGMGAAFIGVVGLVALRFAPVDLAGGVVISAGALVILGFLLVPLAFGVDDTLDPRAFSLFGIPTTRLAVNLAITALVGVPSIVVAIIAVAQVATWARSPLSALLAVIGALVIIVTCTLSARVSTSIAALLLATRRAREVSALVALLAVVLLSPLIVVLLSLNWAKNGLAILSSIARVASWTPLGAAWAAPAAAASGNFGEAIAKALISIAFAALLAVVWRALVAKMLVTPQRISRERDYSGLGWFDRLPDTATGAVAARSITYWLRDARYHTSLLAIPVAPLIFVVVLSVAGVPSTTLALIPIPVMCLFLGWSTHNDIAYDNTAIWLHVASNTSGFTDRIGRLAPTLMIGVPLIIIGTPLCAWWYGSAEILPSLIGVSACILFAGLGLSSVISARFPYPAVRPGDSPFAQPQASGSAAGLIQSLAFFLALLIALPAGVLAAFGIIFGGAWTWGALAVGITFGLGALSLGVRWGASIFSRRAPELLALALRN